MHEGTAYSASRWRASAPNWRRPLWLSGFQSPALRIQRAVPGGQRGQPVHVVVGGLRSVLRHGGFEIEQSSVLFDVQEKRQEGLRGARIERGVVKEMAHPEQNGTGEFMFVDLAGGDPLQHILSAPPVLAGGRPVGHLPGSRLPLEPDFLPPLGLALLQGRLPRRAPGTRPGTPRPCPGRAHGYGPRVRNRSGAVSWSAAHEASSRRRCGRVLFRRALNPFSRHQAL